MTDLKEKYELHFLRNDFIVVALLFAVLLLVLHSLKISLHDLVQNKSDFYSALLTISSGLFVFLITSITILISFLDNEKLKILKDSPQPQNMLDTFFSGIKISGVESIILLFTHINILHTKTLFYIVIFVFILMTARVIRIVWILYNLSSILILSNK